MRFTRSTEDQTRRWAAGAGALIALAYVASAALSGRLSPLARGPLLDGNHAHPPYNWVKPPSYLEATNVKPDQGSFVFPLDAAGNMGQVVATPDGQVSLDVGPGVVSPSATDSSVQIQVQPLDASQFASPGEGLTSFGNVYRLSATYQPTGKPVRSLSKPLTAIMTYPMTSDLQSMHHRVYYSANGDSWKVTEGADSVLTGQVDGRISDIGFIQVAGPIEEFTASSSPGSSSGSGSGGLTWILVAGACVLLLGAGVISWRGRRSRG